MSYEELKDEYRRLQTYYLEYPSDEILKAMQDIEAELLRIERSEPHHAGNYRPSLRDINLN